MNTRPIGTHAFVALLVIGLTGCSNTSIKPYTTSKTEGQTRMVRVVAAENFWGSIAKQLGGAHANVSSVIVNPNSDPHSYEPTAGTLRAIANADLVIINGLGYDSWATKAVQANGSSMQRVITVGKELNLAEDANPHRWYNPDDVERIALLIVNDFKKIDPADSGYFDKQGVAFSTTAMAEYKRIISRIRAKYSGVPVGASESIFAMIAPALGLRLLTPPTFLKAISQGTEPTAADKSAIDSQIKRHLIKVYVYNSQNATPDIQGQIAAAKSEGIPISSITETLVPATSSWEQWQVSQLMALESALAKATGT